MSAFEILLQLTTMFPMHVSSHCISSSEDFIAFCATRHHRLEMLRGDVFCKAPAVHGAAPCASVPLAIPAFSARPRVWRIIFEVGGLQVGLYRRERRRLDARGAVGGAAP